VDLNFNFVNPQQREFYYSRARNQCFSGGFNNGKSFGACLKAFTLLASFPKYHMGITRQTYADLKKTTMQTFFKICPGEFVERHNEQDGLTILKNGSRITWLHLDKVEESTLRGFEPNSILVDQAEEIEEKTYDILDARVGRWDNAEIPEATLEAYRTTTGQDWPKNEKTGKYLAPSYMMLLCNPDTQYHFIYRKYHPDSLERRAKFFFVEGEWDKGLGSAETYENALSHDEEWVDKYMRGKWGISQAQIHRVLSSSFLEYTPKLMDEIKRKANLFRSMDHGEASPTCTIWWAALRGIFIAYREYYQGNTVISEHRRNIHDLSFGETYSGNYADPQIFKKTGQKDGGFWTTADEYLDTVTIKSPPLFWSPADNNEFATRNRINELLRVSEATKNPVTGEPGPGIYFIKKSEEYPYGCYQSINQLQSQRRKLLGYVDGKSVYIDDRDDKVTDHAYDPIRYFISMHGSPQASEKRKPPERSFAWFKMMMKREQNIRATAASVAD
jgi:hypothetical protein